jgi:8-oxo-dGTP diphosphatase
MDTSSGAVLSLYSDSRHTVEGVSAGSGNTAPESVRFCLDCGGSMVTKAVEGTDRRVCVSCRRVHYADPKIAVGVAVFRDDAILLVRRIMEPGRGQWAVPGGWVDAGQDPREAAAREALEEAGVVVDVGEIVDSFLNPPADGGALFLLFTGRWVSGEPVAGDDADDAGFFGRDVLPPLAFASTQAAVAKWPVPDAE